MQHTKKFGLLAALVAVLAMPFAGAADAPLWTSGGVKSSWSYGDMGGDVVYDTNPAGNYNNGECSFIESAALPGALVSGGSLDFTHAYNMERSSFGSKTPYDGGFVLMSVDGGATWSLMAAPYTALNPHATTKACGTSMGVAVTGVFSGIAEKATTSLPLGEVAAESLVKFRFVLSTDSSVARPGWTISAVSVGGLPILPDL